MSTPLHILFLADGIYPFAIGGMQKHSSEMLKGLLEKGCFVKLVFSVGANENIPKEEELLIGLKIDKQYIPQFKWQGLHFPPPGKFPGHYLKESYRFSEIIYNEIRHELIEFDFVYAQGFTAWYLLEQKQKNKKVPVTGVHFHGLNMFQKTFGWKQSLVARMFRKPVRKNLQLADIVFSYGGNFHSIYKKLGVEQKTIFQPIGIDVKEILPSARLSHQPLQLVFIGRQDKVKGLGLYQSVIHKVEPNKFRFIFIGDIPASERLQRNDCYYTGVIDDKSKNEILLQSDVLVCPSYSEGMPYVILEALASGLAVIATNVGAVSELVNETNGSIIEPDDAGALLKSIVNLQTDELNAMKQNAIDTARKFTWDSILDRFIADMNSRISEGR